MEPVKETVREALTRKPAGLISIENLARLLDVSADRLLPLVENNYVRVVTAHEDFPQSIVMRPGQRALEWLTSMFQPIALRPFVPVKEAGKLWGISEREVFKICWTYKIPVSSDTAFGELITFRSLKSLARARAKYHKPKRFDRASLLRYYLSQIEGERWKNPPPYNKSLEEEIRRIGKLPEPARTFRCMDLVLAFRDARTVAESFRWGRRLPMSCRIARSGLAICCGNALGWNSVKLAFDERLSAAHRVGHSRPICSGRPTTPTGC